MKVVSDRLERMPPTRVKTSLTAVRVGVGRDSSCALKDRGYVSCRGGDVPRLLRPRPLHFVEQPWQEWASFRRTVAGMDLCMQVCLLRPRPRLRCPTLLRSSLSPSDNAGNASTRIETERAFEVDRRKEVSSHDRMRRLLTTIGAFVLLGTLGGCAGSEGLIDHFAAKPANRWTVVRQGALVEVSVEHVLYEPAASEGESFLTHVRITNRTASAVGIDLRHTGESFHVNQAGPSGLPHRGAIDELGFMRDEPFRDKERAALVADFRAGALTRIVPGGAFDYFAAFSSPGNPDFKSRRDGLRYFLLVITGSVYAADESRGECVEALVNDGGPSREVALDAPVVWAPLPKGALILKH